MNKQTLPMQGRLPDFLRMQASRDSKPVRENLMSQAADALEAQEKRIRELEGALDTLTLRIEDTVAQEDSGADYIAECRQGRGILRESMLHARRILAEGSKP